MLEKRLKIASVVDDSIVDGPGIRYTIFTQGCTHKCPGCHNPQTHNFNAGSYVSIDDILADIKRFKHLKNITFSGGDPLEQPVALRVFVDHLKAEGYHILVYSGYTFEQILEDPIKLAAISNVDLLIDGRFELSRRTLNLNFRGSDNQRIIDVPSSLASNLVVLSKYN